MKNEVPGLNNFLKNYPGMSLSASGPDEIRLKGDFEFIASYKDDVEIRESIFLDISVPRGFPKAIPVAWDIQKKIPRDGKHHINPNGSLCLGSPINVQMRILAKPTLDGFAENCLVPFLYAIFRKIKYGGDLVIGELEHGKPGIIQDYLNLFDLQNEKQVFSFLQALTLKKRIANRKPCPCGCGLHLGKCNLRYKINFFRNSISRGWFKKHLLLLQKSA